MKRWMLTALIIAALCTALTTTASADSERVRVASLDTYAVVLTSEMLDAGEGSAYAVYTAPYDNAWRSEDSLLKVTSGLPALALGTAHDGGWLWVSYEDDGGAEHVGWIKAQAHTDDLQPFSPSLSPSRLTADVTMTDAPGGGRPIRQLTAGQEITVLRACFDAQTNSFWLYAEVIMDERPLWGFISDQDTEDIPTWHIEGDVLCVDDGVTILGDLWLGYDPERTDNDEPVSRYADFEAGDRACTDLDANFHSFDRVKRIVLPESVRVIGSMALCGLNLEELRLPGSVRDVCNVETLYALRIDRLILARDYVCDLPSLDYSYVGAYEAEPGNPVYSARDGVLFSADQKTLLRYPNGAKAAHYDVPRGVERIGARAFESDDMNNPLLTISLPIGLKEIDQYAFASLGRLISIAIPPTVTKLADTAFANCVSLERVSVPEGSNLTFNTNWAVQGDFTYYNGDNGSTSSALATGADKSFNETANLISQDRSAIPVYRTADSDQPWKLIPFGTRVYTRRVENGRCLVYPTGDYQNSFWVVISNLQIERGDIYFSFSDADFEPGRWTVEETGEPATRDMFDHVSLGYEADRVEFRSITVSGDDWQEYTLSLPLRDAVLYYAGPNDGRTLGYLDAGEMTAAVEILDAPSGSLTGYQFPYTQAEALDSTEGWLHVRTAQYEGWVREDLFIPVYPRQ